MLLLRSKGIQNTHQELNGRGKHHSCRGRHKNHSSHSHRRDSTEEQRLCWPAKPRGQQQEVTETKKKCLLIPLLRRRISLEPIISTDQTSDHGTTTIVKGTPLSKFRLY